MAYGEAPPTPERPPARSPAAVGVGAGAYAEAAAEDARVSAGGGGWISSLPSTPSGGVERRPPALGHPTDAASPTHASAHATGGSAYREMLREVSALMRGCQASLTDQPQLPPPSEQVRAEYLAHMAPPLLPPPPGVAQTGGASGASDTSGALAASAADVDEMAMRHSLQSGPALAPAMALGVPSAAAGVRVVGGPVPEMLHGDHASGGGRGGDHASGGGRGGSGGGGGVVGGGEEARRVEALVRARDAEHDRALAQQRELATALQTTEGELEAQRRATQAVEARLREVEMQLNAQRRGPADADGGGGGAMETGTAGGAATHTHRHDARAARPAMGAVANAAGRAVDSRRDGSGGGGVQQTFDSVLSAQEQYEAQLRDEWAVLEERHAVESSVQCSEVLGMQQRALEQQQGLQRQLHDARRELEVLRIEGMREQQQRLVSARRRELETELSRLKLEQARMRQQRAAGKIQAAARAARDTRARAVQVESERAAQAARALAIAQTERAMMQSTSSSIARAAELALASNFGGEGGGGANGGGGTAGRTDAGDAAAAPTALARRHDEGGGQSAAPEDGLLTELICKLMLDDLNTGHGQARHGRAPASAKACRATSAGSAVAAPLCDPVGGGRGAAPAPAPAPALAPAPPAPPPPPPPALPPQQPPPPTPHEVPSVLPSAVASAACADAARAPERASIGEPPASPPRVAHATVPETALVAREMHRAIDRLEAAGERRELHASLESARALGKEIAGVLAEKLAAALPPAHASALPPASSVGGAETVGKERASRKRRSAVAARSTESSGAVGGRPTPRPERGAEYQYALPAAAATLLYPAGAADPNSPGRLSVSEGEVLLSDGEMLPSEGELPLSDGELTWRDAALRG